MREVVPSAVTSENVVSNIDGIVQNVTRIAVNRLMPPICQVEINWYYPLILMIHIFINTT